jgi:hypothetical protein
MIDGRSSNIPDGMECDRRAFATVALTAALVGAFPVKASPARAARIDVTKFGAHVGKDCRPAIMAGLDALRQSGGGTLVLPPIGGYHISDTVEIDFSPCHIELHDDIALTNTNKSSAFIFRGQKSSPLTDVSIAGIGNIKKIDGNGRSMKNYVYTTKDTFYSCVLFISCIRWHISNIYAYNGLVNCIRAIQCGIGEDVDCDASHSEYDNGHSIDFDPSWRSWSADDPSSWSRAKILRCRAWQCSGLGITSYAASMVAIIDAEVWECGNDIASQPNNGGGISVEGNVGNSSLPDTRNYGGSIIRAKVHDCWNQGLHISAAGTSLRSSDIRGTRAPRNRPNKAGLYGSNILIFSAASLNVTASTLSKSDRHGIGMAAAAGQLPTLDFTGQIINAGASGVFCYSIAKLIISKGSTISNCGTTPYDCGIVVQDITINAKSSQFVDIAGTISGSSGYAINLNNVSSVNLHNLTITRNCHLSNCTGRPLKLVRILNINAYAINIDGQDDRTLRPSEK